MSCRFCCRLFGLRWRIQSSNYETSLFLPIQCIPGAHAWVFVSLKSPQRCRRRPGSLENFTSLHSATTKLKRCPNPYHQPPPFLLEGQRMKSDGTCHRTGVCTSFFRFQFSASVEVSRGSIKIRASPSDELSLIISALSSRRKSSNICIANASSDYGRVTVVAVFGLRGRCTYATEFSSTSTPFLLTHPQKKDLETSHKQRHPCRTRRSLRISALPLIPSRLTTEVSQGFDYSQRCPKVSILYSLLIFSETSRDSR